VTLGAVVLAEIAPRFSRIETLRDALPSLAVIEAIPFAASFLAANAHTNYRQAGGSRKAILPGFRIGAHAAVTGRPLLIGDPRRVATHIPGTIRSPRPTGREALITPVLLFDLRGLTHQVATVPLSADTGDDSVAPARLVSPRRFAARSLDPRRPLWDRRSRR
jgi:hypothetical protein